MSSYEAREHGRAVAKRGQRSRRRPLRNALLCVLFVALLFCCMSISVVANVAHQPPQQQSLQTQVAPLRVPRVYIYPNPDMERGIRSSASYLSGEALFPPAAFLTGSHMIQPLLYSALSSPPYAASPEEADIFIQFVAPFKPPFRTWTKEDEALMDSLGPERVEYLGNNARLSLIKLCRGESTGRCHNR